MDWLDLNEPPFDFGNLDIGNEQDEHVELIDESPDPDEGINVDNTTAPGGGDAADDAGGSATGGGVGAGAANVPGASCAADGGAGNATGSDGPADIQHDMLYDPGEPYVGMTFDSMPLSKSYYNDYANRVGFSIKSNTSRRNTFTKELEKQQFVCNRYKKPADDEVPVEKLLNNYSGDEGSESDGDGVDDDGSKSCSKLSGSSRSSRSGKKKRRREMIKQTNCRARMVVKLNKNGKWEVIYYIGEHNHPMVVQPSLKKYLKSHQGIPEDEEEFLRMLHDCNIETGRMMQIMSRFYGDEFLVPYTTKAISNLRTEFRSEARDSDMTEVLSYFWDLEKDDPDFYFRLKLDSEERVENLFWIDGIARKAYKEAYHDCISFDTTFMTNCYNMPFAPFIGINRHGQTFMLGCGFIRDEKQSSFDWLFETFLHAMEGKAPDCIITDQDIAMRESIKKIFVDTIHRNCRWHIMQNAQKKMGAFLGRNPELTADFNYLVDFTLTPEEFEAGWVDMVQKYRVGWHKELAHLYEIRKTWVPCYFKDCFFPFLQSTQRSEGFNAVLKTYVNPNNSILNFVKQYQKIQVHILVKEGRNDYRTDVLGGETWSPYPIEKQALAVYTRDIFYRFSHEFERIGRYNVRPQGNNLYLIVPNNEWCPVYGSREYTVYANELESEFSCECCKFSRDGLLCCHVLKVFTHIGIDRIPDRYILPRWTQSAVSLLSGGLGQKQQGQVDVMPAESKKQIKVANWTNSFAKIARSASRSDPASSIVDRHLRAMQTEINQLNKTLKKKKAAGQGRLGGEICSGSRAAASTASAGAAPEGPPPEQTDGVASVPKGPQLHHAVGAAPAPPAVPMASPTRPPQTRQHVGPAVASASKRTLSSRVPNSSPARPPAKKNQPSVHAGAPALTPIRNSGVPISSPARPTPSKQPYGHLATPVTTSRVAFGMPMSTQPRPTPTKPTSGHGSAPAMPNTTPRRPPQSQQPVGSAASPAGTTSRRAPGGRTGPHPVSHLSQDPAAATTPASTRARATGLRPSSNLVSASASTHTVLPNTPLPGGPMQEPPGGPGYVDQTVQRLATSPRRDRLILGNPPRSNTKGRLSNNAQGHRYRSALELQPKGKVTCGFCGEEGHTITTCERRLAGSALQKEP